LSGKYTHQIHENSAFPEQVCKKKYHAVTKISKYICKILELYEILLLKQILANVHMLVWEYVTTIIIVIIIMEHFLYVKKHSETVATSLAKEVTNNFKCCYFHDTGFDMKSGYLHFLKCPQVHL
jgi:hypothetical protein